MKYPVIILLLTVICSWSAIEEGIHLFTVVRIKYDGGGDWYGNKTTFINLLKKFSDDTGIETTYKEKTLSIMDEGFFNYPIAYLAGHGNIKFNEQEVKKLRTFLVSGGFLYADDDFGMDLSFRREMKKVFPELNFVELPFSHPIYHQIYDFPGGLPKIHEHAGGPPQGLGLIYKGRLIVFYSFNTDISDGCENPEIHNDPASKREQALAMGVNILLFALLN